MAYRSSIKGLSPNKAGGSGNKKMKKYPRILDYLEARDKEMYDIFDDLAMHGALTPRKGGAITFLNPDSAYRKEIRKIIESDEPEVATEMVSSCILTDLFETPADFQAKQDDIPTLFGTRLLVKKVGPSGVEIEDGSLTLDKEFRPFTRSGSAKRGNLAVWSLKGKVKYAGAPKATYKHLKNGKVEHKTEGGNDQSDQELTNLVRIIEGQEVKACAQNLVSREGKQVSPMCDAVCKVLRYFDETDSQYENYKKARCIMTLCPVIDFYLLFCNPKFFRSEDVLEAYKNGISYENASYLKSFHENRNHKALHDESALIFSAKGSTALTHERTTVIASIIDLASSGQAKNIGGKIKDIYDAIDKSNKLNGVGPIYPDSVHQVFKNNPGLHLSIDEFSFITHKALTKVKGQPDCASKAKELSDLFSIFHECYGAMSGKTMIDKPEFYNAQLDNTGVYAFVVQFWRSFGIHFSCEKPLEEGVYVGSNESEDIFCKEMIDVNADIKDSLDNYDNCPMCLSKSTIAEVKAYVKRHGKLPDMD